MAVFSPAFCYKQKQRKLLVPAAIGFIEQSLVLLAKAQVE